MLFVDPDKLEEDVSRPLEGGWSAMEGGVGRLIRLCACCDESVLFARHAYDAGEYYMMDDDRVVLSNDV